MPVYYRQIYHYLDRGFLIHQVLQMLNVSDVLLFANLESHLGQDVFQFGLKIVTEHFQEFFYHLRGSFSFARPDKYLKASHGEISSLDIDLIFVIDHQLLG